MEKLLLQVMLLADLLPTTTPALLALPHIRELHLCGLGLSDFPKSLAAKMEQLTYIDLSHNRFRRLPEAISLITTLIKIRCCGNPWLQLQSSDVDLLASIPHLRTLDISKSDGGNNIESNLTEESMCTWSVLAKRLPHLRCGTL